VSRLLFACIEWRVASDVAHDSSATRRVYPRRGALCCRRRRI